MEEKKIRNIYELPKNKEIDIFEIPPYKGERATMKYSPMFIYSKDLKLINVKPDRLMIRLPYQKKIYTEIQFDKDGELLPNKEWVLRDINSEIEMILRLKEGNREKIVLEGIVL